MSAIGGVIDFRDGAVEFSFFDNIRRSMALRGREKSSAYIDIGVGMFFNSDEFANEEQPIIRDHRGYKSVFLMDSPFLDGEAVFEKYCCLGVDFLGVIEAPFAIALYDSERRLFLLARDKEGRKPLFYSLQNGRICFASEAKGVLGSMQSEVRVNRDVLSLHLTSVVAIYSAGEIYSDVYEVRAGDCILFTEIGMSRFFFKENTSKKKMLGKTIFKERYKPYESCYTLDKNDMENSLSDSLVAFDIPQFHAYMPMLCKLFSLMKEKEVRIFRYNDYLKKETRKYAYDIEDRLGNFYGVLGSGVVSKIDESSFESMFEERKKIYAFLQERFYKKQAYFNQVLENILGQKKMKYLLGFFDGRDVKKEDTESKIRILGMLCQTFEWVELRDLRFIGEKNSDNIFFDDLN